MNKYTTFLSKIVQEVYSVNLGNGTAPQMVPEISNESACFILIFFDLQALYQPVLDWYTKAEHSALLERYLGLVNLIVSSRPILKNSLVQCKRCHIPFITYFCNRGRSDLGCSFGCRDFLRAENSKIRSGAYYRTAKGKAKKKLLNQKRYLDTSENMEIHTSHRATTRPSLDQTDSKAHQIIPPRTPKPPQQLAGQLIYLQGIVSLLEGRRFSLDEIVSLVEKIQRQHSFFNCHLKMYSLGKRLNSSQRKNRNGRN